METLVAYYTLNRHVKNYVFSQLSINVHATFKYAGHERDDGRRANIDGHTTDNHHMYDDREDNVDDTSIAESTLTSR